MKVAMLSKGWTGYQDAAFAALAARGVELLVVYPDAMENTSFDAFRVDSYAETFVYDKVEGPSLDVVQRVVDFDPDVVVSVSWEVATFRRVLHELRARALRVLWMDNVWRGTLRQRVGVMISPVYLHRTFDAVMVPSDRTEQFARRLGFRADDVIRGSLPADTELFGGEPRRPDSFSEPGSFLGVLRLVEHKGADILAAAYRKYRTMTESPWDLELVGMGPLEPDFAGIEGVKLHGFLQPPAVAELMRSVSAFVNPARLDPYAVVMQEAAAACLPILTSDKVGAAPSMVQDGYNGWTFCAEDVDSLAQALHRMSSQTHERLAEMSRMSYHLAQRLSPEGWARNLEEEARLRLARMGRPTP